VGRIVRGILDGEMLGERDGSNVGLKVGDTLGERDGGDDLGVGKLLMIVLSRYTRYRSISSIFRFQKSYIINMWPVLRSLPLVPVIQISRDSSGISQALDAPIWH
jgi:hypothetical protein